MDNQSTQQDFWEDLENSQKVLQRLKNLKDKLQSYKNIEGLYEDIFAMIELAGEEEDPSFMLEEALDMEKDLTSRLETMLLETLLSQEYDANNAIITLHLQFLV